MDENLRAAIARELKVDPSELRADRSLSSFEFWDSVTALTLMVIFSDLLGATVEPLELVSLRTVGDIEALAAAKQKK